MSIQRLFLILLAAVLLPASAFAQSATRATFTVNKDFSDDNTAFVSVAISCNTGLPLNQSASISETSPITFVVTDFATTLDCTVTETAVTGYATTFSGGDTNVGGCAFTEVASGEANTCTVTNTVSSVTVTVNKDWVIDNPESGATLDSDYSLTLSCDDQDDQIVSATGIDDDTFIFDVVPALGGTSCSVSETTFDSAIEVDNDCGSLSVAVGAGDSCTITNTVFFEGIPTLGQYGMAIMALLMLGVGFVGFRRFV
jgi:hypothetical protein